MAAILRLAGTGTDSLSIRRDVRAADFTRMSQTRDSIVDHRHIYGCGSDFTNDLFSIRKSGRIRRSGDAAGFAGDTRIVSISSRWMGRRRSQLYLLVENGTRRPHDLLMRRSVAHQHR